MDEDDLQAIYDMDGYIRRQQYQGGRPTTIDSKPGAKIDDSDDRIPIGRQQAQKTVNNAGKAELNNFTANLS